MSVQETLQDFAQYTVEKFETNIIHFRDILEEKDKIEPKGFVSESAKSTVSFATEKIPFIGAIISSISGFPTEQAVCYFQKKYVKKDASALCKIVFDTRDRNKMDEYKKKLIELCFILFYSFEKQMMNTTAKTGGKTRAMMKLSHYVINKTLLYLIANDDDDDDDIFVLDKLIDNILTEQNLVHNWYEKIKLKLENSPLPDSDRTITLNINKPVECSTLDFFTKTGVLIEDNDKYYLYSNPNQKPEVYGYRRILDFETKTIKDYKNKDTTTIKYDYTLNFDDKNKIIDELFKFIESRNPKKMELRIKEVIQDTSDDILKILDNYYKVSKDIKIDTGRIRTILEKNGSYLLNTVMDQHTANMVRFDEAQRDRDLKHEEILEKLDKLSVTNTAVPTAQGVGNSSLIPTGPRDLVSVNDFNAQLDNFNQNQIQRILKKEIQDFYNDF